MFRSYSDLTNYSSLNHFTKHFIIITWINKEKDIDMNGSNKNKKYKKIQNNMVGKLGFSLEEFLGMNNFVYGLDNGSNIHFLRYVSKMAKLKDHFEA